MILNNQLKDLILKMPKNKEEIKEWSVKEAFDE